MHMGQFKSSILREFSFGSFVLLTISLELKMISQNTSRTVIGSIPNNIFQRVFFIKYFEVKSISDGEMLIRT